MDAIVNSTNSYIKDLLSQTISQFFAIPSHFVSKLIQLVFFTSAISSFIIFLLKFIKFQYAEAFTNNWIFRIVVGLMFFYIQIWDHWVSQFVYLNYFCSVIICLYIYDCCSNIGDAYKDYSKKNGIFKDAYLIMATFCCFLSLLYSIYLGKFSGQLFISLYGKQQSNTLAYMFLFWILIIVCNLFRPARSVYALIFNTVLFGIVIIRHTFIVLEIKSIFFSYPVEAIPYLLMAFDAQAKQSIKINNKKFQMNYYLLWFCTGFYVYTIMNQRLFPIELVFGMVALGMSIFNR